jgi:hypothetical protein
MEPEPSNALPPKRNRRWFQFSLRTLMIFIVAASLALAAMKFATSAWANVVVNVTMFGLLFSVVLAVYRRQFRIGFAICGIGYLALVESHFASDFVGRLITTRTVESLRDMFHPQADYFPAGYLEGSRPNISSEDVNRGSSNWSEMAANFRLIGTCLWVLILATLGGMLAQIAAGRSHVQAGPESSRP